MPMKQPHVLTVRMSDQLKDAVEYHARSHDVHLADVVRKALRQYLELPEPGL